MRVRLLAAAVALLVAPSLASALDPAIKCQAAKLKLAGKYASCRLLTDAAAVKQGVASDYTTCDSKLQEGWAKVEAALGTDCPTTGDLGDVQDSIVECIPASRYLIRIGIVSSHTFGAVQIDIDYSAASGSFEGTGSSVHCTNSVPGVLAAYLDSDSEKLLQDGHISTSNFASPIELSQCTFEVTSIVAPDPADFVLTVADATDPFGNPIPGVVPGIVIERIP